MNKRNILQEIFTPEDFSPNELDIIVLSAILSAPTPVQQLAFEQLNVAVLQFPFTFLPAVVVPIVLISHLYVFYHLKKKKH